ncbi:YgaP family membrane protein [Haloglomus litoreum]|uniref:YgaP family membrane protein n=1 Tax=Haloglomus litoreum TaxID=3034026 RepID=UPI0023E7BB10|nr:DUF2892 domain-containing protein [Haloglomus sp. DT116]
MEKNVGGYDRIARLVVGPILAIVGTAALLGYVTIAAGTLGLALAAIALLVGLVFVVTGLTQKCPLNSLLGLDTYRKSSEAEEAEVGPGRTA